MDKDVYAIDIAMIPEEGVISNIIGLNRELAAVTGDPSIFLGESRCLPHISLAMCSIPAFAVSELGEQLAASLEGRMPYTAEFSGFAVVETSCGDMVSGADIVRDEKIMEIQEKIVDVLDEIGTVDVTPESFFLFEKGISAFSVGYAGSYLNKQIGRNFSPHITIGKGDVLGLEHASDFPATFSCDRLAICHLGNDCTCANILDVVRTG